MMKKRYGMLPILVILIQLETPTVLALFYQPASAIQEPLVTIHIKNASGIERKEEVVEMDFVQIADKLQRDELFKVIEKGTNKEIPYQLEYRGSKKPQNLLLQISLKPNQEIVIEIQSGKPSDLKPKTFARFVPERKDDFAWENDQIAFRMYGPALEGTAEDAHGIDVWTKLTTDLIINKWYKSDDYHTDHGEGLDYYSVGMTLGAGDIAPYVDGEIIYSKNYAKYEVLDNGPLRSLFKLTYDSWEVGSASVKVSKTISLDAGSQLSRIEVEYTVTSADTILAVIGIAKRLDGGNIWLDEQDGIMGYWEPEQGQNGITGVGVIIPKWKKMKVTDEHLLTMLKATSQKSVVYYSGATWNKADRIKSAEEWFRYLAHFKYKLEHPVEIEVL